MSEEEEGSTTPSTKSGAFLRIHRQTVESSQKMSPAILLGSSLALAMGLFVWGGMAFDGKFDTEPLGVVTGLILGLLFGVYEIWKVIHFAEAAEEPDSSAADTDSETES